MGYILVVDDELPMRTMLRRWLEDAGHECQEAESADAALLRMAKSPADVAFCDIQMPGKDGIWLTGEIRRAYPGTPVVLATGISTVPPRVSMQAGVLAYLVKPIARAAFLDALAIALKWHEDTKQQGHKPEDVGSKLTDWLDELSDL